MAKENNKVVLVTGCSSGIGLELIKRYIAKGCIAYGVSRRELTIPHLHYSPCDVTDLETCKIVVDKIIKEQGHIDIVVNNAGIGISGPVEYASKSEVKKIFDVNFFGAWNIMKAVLPYMREQKYGNIINVSSVASFVPIPYQAFYSASKSALDTLTSATRSEVKEFGINVVTIHPGDAKTGFTGAREKKQLKDGDPYAKTCNHSIEQMEKDETTGMSAVKVAKTIYNISMKSKPHIKTIVGAKYKFFSFALSLLPKKAQEWAVRKMYFGKDDEEESEIEIIEPDKNKKSEE